MLRSSGHGLELGRYRLDLDVYRVASQTWLHGTALYGPLPATSDGTAGLPFSYPPISAVALSPLSVIPLAVAETLMVIIGVVLLAVVLRVFLRSLEQTQVKPRWQVKWLLPAALLLEPVRNTLNYGQVNIILMTLVTVDCLFRGPGKTRGVLVGLAAALKLTPAIFVLYFLVKKDYRAACMAAVSFAVFSGVGFLLAWRDSVSYWTSIIFQPSRDGAVGYAANQSLQGVLARAGVTMDASGGKALWLGLSLLTIIVAYAGMRRARDAGLDAWVLSLNAFAGLLVSPISWSHHWVWAVPAMLALGLISWRFRDKAGIAVAVAGTVILAVAPHWLMNGTQTDAPPNWSAWQQVIGDSYAILAAVILLFSVTLFKWRQSVPDVREEPLIDLAKRVSDPQLGIASPGSSLG
jgi:alpha-1,2-mannosyltransferase